MSLREQKKLDTRKHLIETAYKLFAERGFTATSVDEVARAANVSRSTFFRYFDSKEGVIFADRDEMSEYFRKSLEARPPDEPPLLAFERCLTELAARTGEEEKRMALMFWGLLAANPELRARHNQNSELMAKRIAVALAEREGKKEPDERHTLAASVGLLVVEAANQDWQEANGELDGPSLVRSKFRLLREIAASPA